MPPAPRVAVIVPVRDRADLLRRCLHALAAQRHADFEVVVVDDGSSDGSGAVARAWAEGRMATVIEGPRAGAVRARTLGVSATEAELLAFTDSDCEPDPGWLEALVAALDRGADAVQGCTLPAASVPPGARSMAVTSEDGLYATCNIAYRRSAFCAAGGFDGAAGDRLGFRPGPTLRGLGFGEDTLLGWRVRVSGRVVFEPAAVVRHAVLHEGLAEQMRRAWAAGAFPALLGEVPDLRRTLLRHRTFLGSPRRVPLLAAVPLALVSPRGALTGLALWGGLRARELHRQTGSWRLTARGLPIAAAVDAVTAAALVAGSARSRHLVL